MKNLKIFTASAAAVLALSVAGSANAADTYTLFSGNCIDNSNVTGSKSLGVDKVYFVKDKSDLSSVTGTGNFYLRLVDNLFQVTNVSKSIVYLEGNATILQNTYAYAGSNGPEFNYSGTVEYTGGLWIDPLRDFMNVPTHVDRNLTGTWEFSGTSAAPKGVDYLNITVSSPVPEPGEWAAMGMLASGLGGLVVRARRRKLA
ncbi:MAG: PEP-CTERM sorting domain-containing protein [Armatimonadaceae bacterium]